MNQSERFRSREAQKPDEAAPRQGMINQEAMKPREKGLFMAFWLLNTSLHFSGFHGFLLVL